MTTPRDLLEGSLELIGVIGANESIEPDQISGLFKRLNRMLDMWSSQSATIYADTEIFHALTSGDGEYTIGSGADIDTTLPTKIKYAYVRQGSNDYPLEIIDEYKFANIYKKDTQGSYPDALYFEEGYPTGKIKLWPLPSAAYTLYMGVEQPLTAFTGLSQVISLPPGYEEAIEYNFAKRLAGSYGKSLTAEQAELAEDGFNNIKSANRRNDRYEASVNFPGQSHGNFDIYSARKV